MRRVRVFHVPSVEVPDPGITVGPYRILQRTDGLFIVCDFRRALGDATMASGKTLGNAIREAKRLAGPGVKVVSSGDRQMERVTRSLLDRPR